MKVKFILSGIMLAGALQVAAQTQQPRDKAYVEENTISSQPIPYPYMREADVMWEKRVWQEIDVREKMNEVLMHTRQEERRVGKECVSKSRSRWSQENEKKTRNKK